jgi:4-amino-4-deoxy-L-arabinose transferase-like glycosyltransferase
LLTAASLATDRDLDVANEYRSAAYRSSFDSSEPLWYQSVPAPDGRELTPHDPGLPLLLAPAYALSGAVLAKRFLAILAALMVVLVLVITRRLTGRTDAALLAAVALMVTAPMFVYATQVYPELPAALVITCLIWLVLSAARRPFLRAVLLAAGVIALPWLGIKYALVGAVVTAFAMFRLGRRASALLLALLVIGGVHYVWFDLSRYGGITP